MRAARESVVILQVVDIRDAGSVRQQVVQRDAIALREIGKVVRQRVGNLQAALFLKLENRGGGEQLRDRGDVEAGFCGIWNLPFVIGHPVGLFEEDSPISSDQDGSGKVASGGERCKIGPDASGDGGI